VIERERIGAAEAAGAPLTDGRGQRRVLLSNESIDKTLVLFANILDDAVERGRLETNPAGGKRRRLKAARPTRRVLEFDELVGSWLRTARWTGANDEIVRSVAGR
jgi:hypothetical protein